MVFEAYCTANVFRFFDMHGIAYIVNHCTTLNTVVTIIDTFSVGN